MIPPDRLRSLGWTLPMPVQLALAIAKATSWDGAPDLERLIREIVREEIAALFPEDSA